MNKSLLIFSLACLFVLAISNPCQEADLLHIINRATGYYLGTSAGSNLLVLNYDYQLWCLNDESRSFYVPVPELNKNTPNTGIVLYKNGENNVIQVRGGVLSNAVLDLVPVEEATCYEADWEITFLPDSHMFSIRTVLENASQLAISAVSTNPQDGVTLKPFNPADTLQQWIIQR